MRITQVDSQLLRVPMNRPLTAPGAGDPATRVEHTFVLVVHLDTDAGHRGLGFAYEVGGGGRAIKIITDDDLAPLVTGEDPLDHERLGVKVQRRVQSFGRVGLVAHAYSAIDVALWDLKGKVAGLPLYKLLGGARESIPAYVADCGWPWMSAEDTVKAASKHLEQGLMGVKIHLGSQGPEADADRLTRVREALGEDAWLGVDAHHRYDYATALSMGEFFAGEIGVDWLEEPMPVDDVAGHARLCERLDVPIALGESLFSREEFRDYFERDAVDIIQPDVTRVGGITPFLRIAALADLHHRPIAPHLLPEISVHLACGLPNVAVVEYMPWLFPIFAEAPAVVKGKLVPFARPGLGLEIDPDVAEKYRVQV